MIVGLLTTDLHGCTIYRHPVGTPIRTPEPACLPGKSGRYPTREEAKVAEGHVVKMPSGRWQASVFWKKPFYRAKKTWDTEREAKDWVASERVKYNAKALGKYVAPEGTIGDLVRK